MVLNSRIISQGGRGIDHILNAPKAGNSQSCSGFRRLSSHSGTSLGLGKATWLSALPMT